ncbi:hypothetical protein G3I76_54055 [Streptomyces sp. SID11233]|uniref:hypothetical protein n=1 Tax=Streptomyces sp. SID11385 TaxID=2706031 RepID=UPI0013C28A7F|nr:hypothetical protein [Streptomyces sp. SID11385]NEA37769.1 hypothetical protein [Streptomyces sp. SID11385]NED88981.1 hypothetical protein [Streptomyces sp. SID11233]
MHDLNPVPSGGQEEQTASERFVLLPRGGGAVGQEFQKMLVWVQESYSGLEGLSQPFREQALMLLATQFEISGFRIADVSDERHTSENSRQEMTVREFMAKKRPDSLVERIACLGFYLTYHREHPHFTVRDITQLNTEAAGQKFGNPARDMDNADRQNGYVVAASHGVKQLTPRGEALVRALPDRAQVKQALAEHRFKPRRHASSARPTTPKGTDE